MTLDEVEQLIGRGVTVETPDPALGGKLAGTGAQSYSAGDATGGSEEAARFKAR